MKYPNPSLDTQITIEFYYGNDCVRKTIAIKNLDGYIEDTNYKDLKVLSYNIESNQELKNLIVLDKNDVMNLASEIESLP